MLVRFCACVRGFQECSCFLYFWIQIEEKLNGKLYNFSLIATLKALYTKLFHEDLVPFSSAEKKTCLWLRGGKDKCRFLFLSRFGHCGQMPWRALGFSLWQTVLLSLVQGGLTLICLGLKYLSSWEVQRYKLNYWTWDWPTYHRLFLIKS